MGRGAAAWLVGVTIAVGATLCGCTAGDGSAPTSAAATPTRATASATPTATASTAPTTAEARAELQAYLDAWRTDGPAAASQAYLAGDQQVSDDADAPHLASGTVVDLTDAEPTPEGPRFQARLELSFDGDPVAWTDGTNDRFVTFTPRAGDVPYAMSFATGP